jgi:hypothetical protein
MKDCRSRIAEMHRAENVQWGLRSGVGYALLRGGPSSRKLDVHSLCIAVVCMFARYKYKKQILVLSLLTYYEHDPMRSQPA